MTAPDGALGQLLGGLRMQDFETAAAAVSCSPEDPSNHVGSKDDHLVGIASD